MTPLTELELEYNIDWDGPVSHQNDEESSAVVEPSYMQLIEHDWNLLVRQYQRHLYPAIKRVENNLMSSTTNYGVDMYLEVRGWIEREIAIYNN